MTDKLLPCPFCGGDAEQDYMQGYRTMQGGRLDHAAAIYCTVCDAHMTMCRADHPSLIDEERMSVLVESWNKRLPPPETQAAGSFQSRVQPWMMACFGEMIAGDREERNHRFLEEALELVQSTGCTAHEAHLLVDYVYGRPVGEPHQEVGGVMVTLAALCLANALDMHDAGETELTRIWTKVEAIRAKQAAKPKHSPLPGPSAASAEGQP